MRFVAAAIILILASVSADAAVYYVATNGTSSGTGSSSSPWDLNTALRSGGNPASTIQPGDIVWIRGGTYPGIFVNNNNGSSVAKITFRNVPGEKPKVDGNWTTTLSATITAGASSLTLPINTIASATEIRIDNEDIQIASGASGGGPYTYLITRPRNGTTAASHTGGAAVTIKGSSFMDQGSYCRFWGLEVFDSSTERRIPDPTYANFRGDGFELRGANVDVINCFSHDGLNGFGFWEQATNSTMEGCISINNGYQHAVTDDLNGGGHSLYTENTAPSTKRVVDFVSINPYGYALHAFATNNFVENYLFDGIMVSGGGKSTYANGGASAPTAHIGASTNPAAGITITNSSFYDDARPGTGVTLGYAGVHEIDLTATNNTFDAGHLDVAEWDTVTFTGNIATQTVANPSGRYVVFCDTPTGRTAPLSTWYTWDNNAYYLEDLSQFALKIQSGTGNTMNFATWKSNTSLDPNSTVTSGRPSGTKVVVRPNRYERGRAHIAIYNWAGGSSVTVPLGDILRPGDAFKVTLLERYDQAPILVGVYNGVSISVPMTGLGSPTAPIGTGMVAAATTLPTYGVFLLERLP